MEISRKTQKALGPEVAAFYSETKKRYIARIELPMGADGKRRRREITATTEEVLIPKVRAALVKFRAAGDLATSSPTVKTWLTYWLDNVAARRVRPKTLAGYRSVVNRQIIEAIGNVRLEKLAGVHFRRVEDFILENGHSSTYALNAHRVLAKAIEDAVREGKMHENPAKHTDAPRRARSTLQALDVSEAIDVVKRCSPAFKTEPYDPYPALWATYLLTGPRRGEVLGLEWDRVHFDGDSNIDLAWQLQRLTDKEIADAPADFEYRPIEHGLYWTRPKSSAGWRVIPLVDPLMYILEQHKTHAVKSPYGLVFSNKNGGPLDPDTITKRWAASLQAMNVTDKKVRLHDLRHTTVDLLYEAGVPEDIIMEIVGHSVRTVTRGYKSRGNQLRRTEGMRQLSALFNAPSLARPEVTASSSAETNDAE